MKKIFMSIIAFVAMATFANAQTYIGQGTTLSINETKVFILQDGEMQNLVATDLGNGCMLLADANNTVAVNIYCITADGIAPIMMSGAGDELILVTN